VKVSPLAPVPRHEIRSQPHAQHPDPAQHHRSQERAIHILRCVFVIVLYGTFTAPCARGSKPAGHCVVWS
jgi:hypothetical protein